MSVSRTTFVLGTSSALVIGHFFGPIWSNRVLESVSNAVVMCQTYLVDTIVGKMPPSIVKPVIQMCSFIGIESTRDLVETVLFIDFIVFTIYISICILRCCCGGRKNN